jgi:hypothetical protein
LVIFHTVEPLCNSLRPQQVSRGIAEMLASQQQAGAARHRREPTASCPRAPAPDEPIVQLGTPVGVRACALVSGVVQPIARVVRDPP